MLVAALAELVVDVCAAEEAVELDDFVVLNNPAACAVELADSVCDDGVKLSCGRPELAAAGVPAADPVVELCVCGVDCWLTELAFRLTMLVTDMIHLHVGAKLERQLRRRLRITRASTREW